MHKALLLNSIRLIESRVREFGLLDFDLTQKNVQHLVCQHAILRISGGSDSKPKSTINGRLSERSCAEKKIPERGRENENVLHAAIMPLYLEQKEHDQMVENEKQSMERT